MIITYDQHKDQINRGKHAVSLAVAVGIEWGAALEKRDDRHDYGEQRYRAHAPIGERLYCVVYVDRDEGRRIISLRKANAREVKEYVEANL